MAKRRGKKKGGNKGPGQATKVRKKMFEEANVAMATNALVSLGQGYAKKTNAFTLPTFKGINPDLLWGSGLLLVSLVLRRNGRKSGYGTAAFNLGMPLFTIGSRAWAASGFDPQAVSGYNAGFRITEDDFDANRGAYDDGEF